MCDVKTPCPECPFSRSCKPGELGGSSPFVYIGQSIGPFVLPCHLHINYNDPLWREKAINTPQCAGAAVFRANIGLTKHMPDLIHRLEPDTSKVFATPSEFLAHHLQVDESKVQQFNDPDVLLRLMRLEMNKRSVITYEVQP